MRKVFERISSFGLLIAFSYYVLWHEKGYTTLGQAFTVSCVLVVIYQITKEN